jgi:glycosyltransferase involved in cell wall biosynthesis
MASSVLVVPCFNEERRLDRDGFGWLAKQPELKLLFVDDGSTDGTRRVLEDMGANVLVLERNFGKGEAVRRGMLAGLERGVPVVGYADADLSTAPAELVRLRDKLVSDRLDVVVGARVLLIGTQIERRLVRHALGRIFATVAAEILDMPFYDTQCGAKFFRNVPALGAALATPFGSRWAFDVELLGRLRIGTREAPGVPVENFREVPLEKWHDVPDSKLRFGGMAKTLVDLARIARDLARRRKDAG